MGTDTIMIMQQENELEVLALQINKTTKKGVGK